MTENFVAAKYAKDIGYPVCTVFFLVANMFVISLCTDVHIIFLCNWLLFLNSRLRLPKRNASKLVTKNDSKMHSTNKLEQLFKLNAFSLYSSSILTTGYLLLFWAQLIQYRV